MRRCLIIVAKEPAAGRTKTRLAAGIGAERALALYRCFLRDTIALAAGVADCSVALSFWPETAAEAFRARHPGALLFPQQGEDFGARLLSAFRQAAAQGFDRAVLIGSDNPSLPRAYVERAFAALDTHPAVLGPAEDGGYYLIGMREPQPGLFHGGIAWSTEVVAEQTRAAALAERLALAEVPPWYDIDTADDLRLLYRDLLRRREGAAAAHTLELLARYAGDGLADLLGDERQATADEGR